MANYCLVHKDGGPVSTKLTVDNGGQSGSKFWLWKNDNGTYTPEEKHQVATDDSGSVILDIKIKPSDLEGIVLTWVLQSCSKIPQVENLTIKIECFQDGEKCKTTSENKYSGKYPQCSSGTAVKNRGQLTFTSFDHPEEERLWANMD